jgi:hypothetical protein
MLEKQLFKTYDGAVKRAAFERAHSNYNWHVVRCDENGVPLGLHTPVPFSRDATYTYRLEKRKP